MLYLMNSWNFISTGKSFLLHVYVCVCVYMIYVF